MPDIAMCENEKCTLKEKCYRYKAKPSEWLQTYSDFKQDEKGDCKYFMKILGNNIKTLP